jgi:hypothetical protein
VTDLLKLHVEHNHDDEVRLGVIVSNFNLIFKNFNVVDIMSVVASMKYNFHFVQVSNNMILTCIIDVGGFVTCYCVEKVYLLSLNKIVLTMK